MGFGGFGGNQMGSFSSDDTSSSNPFGGGNPFGGSNPFGSGADGGDAEISQEELESLLQQSPFGRLFDIPGVESEDIIGAFGQGNPFAEGGVSVSNDSEGEASNSGEAPANGSDLEFPDGDSFSGIFPEGEYDFSNVDGEYDFSNVDGEYDFSNIDGEYDFSRSEEVFSEENSVSLDNGENSTAGNPFAGGEGMSVPGNPFLGEEVTLNIEDGDYLLKRDDSWYISSDEEVSDDDQLLFEGYDVFAQESSGNDNPFAEGFGSFAGGENPFGGDLAAPA